MLRRRELLGLGVLAGGAVAIGTGALNGGRATADDEEPHGFGCAEFGTSPFGAADPPC